MGWVNGLLLSEYWTVMKGLQGTESTETTDILLNMSMDTRKIWLWKIIKSNESDIKTFFLLFVNEMFIHLMWE